MSIHETGTGMTRPTYAELVTALRECLRVIQMRPGYTMTCAKAAGLLARVDAQPPARARRKG